MTSHLSPAPSPLSLVDGVAPALGSRELFPELRFHSFLAHAAISPLNVAGLRAVEACMHSFARGGNEAFPMWMAQRERLRQSLAHLFGARAEDVALTAGCTRGITDVALALPWKPGDVLLTFDGEFPANVTPWQQAAAIYGGSVRFLPRPDPSAPKLKQMLLEQVERELKGGKVRYVAVSAVQFQTGLLMPLLELGELCQKYDAILLVDAIQGAGVVPFDLGQLKIGAFFSGCHKWMLGMEGAGFMIIDPELTERLSPRTAGWLSHEQGELFLFQGADLLKYDRPLQKGPRVFEGSTANAAGFAALEAGVDIISALTPQKIFEHTQAFHDRLELRMMEMGFLSQRAFDATLRSAIVSYLPPSGVSLTRLFSLLSEAHVRVSIPDGYLRIAPHYANSLSEVDVIAQAVIGALARAV